MTRYTLLLTDDETGEPRARLTYHFMAGDQWDEDTIVVDESIPAGYQLTEPDELDLRHHADRIDLDNIREARQPEFELSLMRPIRWGVKG